MLKTDVFVWLTVNWFVRQDLNHLNSVKIQFNLLNIKYCLENIENKSRKYCLAFFIENHLKLMKNIFYFTLKAYFVLKIFKFLYFHLNI